MDNDSSIIRKISNNSGNAENPMFTAKEKKKLLQNLPLDCKMQCKALSNVVLYNLDALPHASPYLCYELCVPH